MIPKQSHLLPPSPSPRIKGTPSENEGLYRAFELTGEILKAKPHPKRKRFWHRSEQ